MWTVLNQHNAYGGFFFHLSSIYLLLSVISPDWTGESAQRWVKWLRIIFLLYHLSCFSHLSAYITHILSYITDISIQLFLLYRNYWFFRHCEDSCRLATLDIDEIIIWHQGAQCKQTPKCSPCFLPELCSRLCCYQHWHCPD